MILKVSYYTVTVHELIKYTVKHHYNAPQKLSHVITTHFEFQISISSGFFYYGPPSVHCQTLYNNKFVQMVAMNQGFAV